jgi:glycerophosphoryl diester phosphodiesterase
MDVIAHRGASGHAPEHTFAAYDLALAQGADMLELDVRARDGELVVLHDTTTRRTGREPLTLDAVLGRYRDRTRWLVELKDPDPSWELEAVAALRRHGLLDRAVVQSFDSAAMRRLRIAAPGLSVAPLWRRRPSVRRLDRIARYATAIGVWHGALDVGLVAAAHARGLGVRAWTVNGADAIDRVLALGVDGVITDLPDVAGAVVRERAATALVA